VAAAQNLKRPIKLLSPSAPMLSTTRYTYLRRFVFIVSPMNGEVRSPMQTQRPKVILVLRLEQALAVLAAAATVFLTIRIWLSVSAQQSMWPLPGLYFVELSAVAIITALAFLYASRWSPLVAWAAAGIVLAFAILGAFSVGLFYFPISLIFITLGVLATVRQEKSWLPGIGAFLIAAAAQATLVLLLIRLL
jgi:hypothetical protein